ncbi:MAG: ABC transporter permease [Phycisphaerales bacterium]
MSISDRLAKLDRIQKSLPFKVGATILILLLAFGTIGYVMLDAASEPGDIRDRLGQVLDNAELAQAEAERAASEAGDEMLSSSQVDEVARIRSITDVIEASRSPVSLGIGLGLAASLILLFVWLGLGLTYLGVSLVIAAIGIPLILSPRTAALGYVILGGGQLVMSLAALLRAGSMMLSGAHPVLAIARNVLAEAVRMKLSLLFIAMLITGLAFMPIILNGEQPLRFRIQGFLQYANMITFGIVALLVLFFGVATVAFEQRDKIIWQTMTKPVPSYQYVLGKWLGVVVLAAILLLVSSTGVFLFTEGLRRTTAVGEIHAFQPMDESIAMTEDRMILETRVLTARRSVYPNLPFTYNDEQFDEAVQRRVEDLQRQGDFVPTRADRQKYREEAIRQAQTEYRSIDPIVEGSEEYLFIGLGEAKAQNIPLTLNYRVEAEGNRPDVFYNLTFLFSDTGTLEGPLKTGLGFTHSMNIAPRLIDQNGHLRFRLFNGALEQTPEGDIGLRPNTNSITIPPSGLEVSYRVGSFRGNFLRVQAVQWVKLAFLAMIAVSAATFLSFPVASLISIGVFFLAQSSGWVQGALPGWGTTTVEGDFDAFRFAIFHFSDFISGLFKVYDDLRPTERLADGRVLTWAMVARGVSVLGLLSLLIYGLGVYAFRSRQLAVYSGQ